MRGRDSYTQGKASFPDKNASPNHRKSGLFSQ